jgi:hypothetical protein
MWEATEPEPWLFRPRRHLPTGQQFLSPASRMQDPRTHCSWILGSSRELRTAELPAHSDSPAGSAACLCDTARMANAARRLLTAALVVGLLTSRASAIVGGCTPWLLQRSGHPPEGSKPRNLRKLTHLEALTASAPTLAKLGRGQAQEWMLSDHIDRFFYRLSNVVVLGPLHKFSVIVLATSLLILLGGCLLRASMS